MNTFEIMRLITDSSRESLTSTETSILMVMALLGDRNGKNINPGIKKISSKTKFSERAVKNSILSLVRKKVLFIVSQRKQGDNSRSCYEFNIPIFKEEIFKKPSARRSPGLVHDVPQVTDENSKTWCTTFPRPSARRSPGLVHDVHLHLIQPILEPMINLSNVELGANSTPSSSPKKLKKIKKSWKEEISDIFGHWQKVLNHPVSKLDKKRYDRIEKALEMGYSVEDLKKAIDGIKRSEFHMGDNGKHKKYDGIHVIFRDPEQIEGFISDFDTQTTPRNKNVTTGLKMTFVERNKSQVNMMDDIEAKYFPEFANRGKKDISKENLLTFRKEREINERE